MIAQSETDLTADRSRNLLTVRFRGTITALALKVRLNDAAEIIGQMRPGFTVFTDLSDLDSMELDCVESLTRLMEMFKASGVSTVVRVIPDREKDIGFNILSLTHYRRGVSVVTCETCAEAERWLPGAQPSV